MTRLGVISDVHGDVAALADALTRLDELGVDTVICAGDVVDYGPCPNETIELLQREAIACIRGNHERWKLTPTSEGARRFADEVWLSDSSLAYLAELPVAWDKRIDGVRVSMRHAQPLSDAKGIFPDQISIDDMRLWLDQVQADVLIVGHTHLPFEITALGGGSIVNPGALLRNITDQRYVHKQDRAGGTFGVLELPSLSFKVYRAATGTEVDLPRWHLGVRDSRAR